MEHLAPLTARTVPYRKWLMCREEVRAATISSTASCGEEDGTEREFLRADTAADSGNLVFNVALHE